MINKVVYISIFVMFSILSNGYSQKSSLNLLPSDAKEIISSDLNTEQNSDQKKVATTSFSRKEMLITPKIKDKRKYSERTKYRIYNIIGSICKEKWSSGIMKIFKLPGTSGLTIY